MYASIMYHTPTFVPSYDDPVKFIQFKNQLFSFCMWMFSTSDTPI